jgi:hypothetical protein
VKQRLRVAALGWLCMSALAVGLVGLGAALCAALRLVHRSRASALLSAGWLVVRGIRGLGEAKMLCLVLGRQQIGLVCASGGGVCCRSPALLSCITHRAVALGFVKSVLGCNGMVAVHQCLACWVTLGWVWGFCCAALATRHSRFARHTLVGRRVVHPTRSTRCKGLRYLLGLLLVSGGSGRVGGPVCCLLLCSSSPHRHGWLARCMRCINWYEAPCVESSMSVWGRVGSAAAASLAHDCRCFPSVSRGLWHNWYGGLLLARLFGARGCRSGCVRLSARASPGLHSASASQHKQ